MDGGYELRVDPPDFWFQKLVGFFDKDLLARFVADREQSFKALRSAPNAHVTLADLSECHLQSQEMFWDFAKLLQRPDMRSRKLAILLPSRLGRMQVKRMLFGREDVAFFDTQDEATRWLRAHD